MTFIDELIAESEIRDKAHQLEMTKLRADQVLAALTVLETQADDVGKLCDAEIKIIEEYRAVEHQKLAKKMGWLEWQLEQFMRSTNAQTNEKTLNLAHGSIKLRMGRDKLEITDLEKYRPFAQSKGLLKQIPESYEPDMQKLQAHLKIYRTIPPGVSLIPAQTKFSYKTLRKESNGNRKETESEVGAEAE